MLEVEVLGVLHRRSAAADRALRRTELLGGVCAAALVAAVAVLVRGAALRARALHEPVGQEHPALVAPQLRGCARGHRAALLHGGEDAFGELLVLGRIGGVVVVELHLEVREVLHVQSMAAGDQLLRRNALVARPYHDGRAVRIVGAYVNAAIPAHLLEPHPEIRLEILHQMPEMYVPVCIGERARDHYLPALCHVRLLSFLKERIIPHPSRASKCTGARLSAGLRGADWLSGS